MEGFQLKASQSRQVLFLNLSDCCIQDIILQLDRDGLNYVRGAMNMTYLALNNNGCWEVGQLTPEPQMIVPKHKGAFDLYNLPLWMRSTYYKVYVSITLVYIE